MTSEHTREPAVVRDRTQVAKGKAQVMSLLREHAATRPDATYDAILAANRKRRLEQVRE